ncbi:MAG TPA: TlpA disulfide reductase family protein [Bryobacteraceae bacterium]|nr:TlpA disulfide reductase family protein [Bryobacteraceae bacterium]
MRFGALLLSGSGLIFAQASPSAKLIGSWVNTDLDTSGTTQVVVRQNKGGIVVHVWGRCTPSDCDWGEAAADTWDGYLIANYDHGWSMARLQLIPLPDGRLLMAHTTEYRDGSGRTDKGYAEFFAREDAKVEGPETAKARELLHQVAETYRNLPAARFESTEIRQRSSEKTETRSETRATLLFSPPNRWRRETSRTGGEARVEIADGHTSWTVYPQANQYQSVPQGPAARPFAYHLLDRGRSTPEILRHERLGAADCTVVRISLGRGVTEDLWIVDGTHLVAKEKTEDRTSKDELTFTVTELGVKVAPEAVAYAPDETHAVNRTTAAQEAPKTMVGTTAPDVVLRDLDGHAVKLSELRGKVVLLDFWATWCGYCRQALPTIELLHRSLEAKGLVVYGVDDEAPEIARAYLQKSGYTMPSLVDSASAAAHAFFVNSWPTTVLIDREGKVAYYEAGSEAEALRDAIRAAGAW